jgi:phytoene dehydrogenase-like protein
MTPVFDHDVVVVAGHNGLAATALLAARGFRVLCLEKNAYVGGMAGTREILTGCRNDVGASLLFPLAKGLASELELERYGVEFIDLPIMASNLNSPTRRPRSLLNRVRMALYVLHSARRHGRVHPPDGVLQVPGG